jgi:hypothetical protein
MALAVDYQPNKVEVRKDVQVSNGYVRRNFIDSPTDEVATSDDVMAAYTTGANLVTAGLTNPDVPRVLSIVSTGTDHDAAGVVTINGTDIRGNVISDAITLNGATVVNGVKAFATVTSVDLTAVTAIDANAGVAVGRTDILGLDRCMSENGVILATLGGTKEATAPTVTYSATVVSQNTVLLSTDLDGSSDVVVWFCTAELTSQANTVMPIA